METKICTKCNDEKDISLFYFMKKLNLYRAECLECGKKRSKKYKENNKEKIQSYDKKYIKRNSDKIKQQRKDRDKNKSEKISKQQKEYKEKNKTKINEWSRDYRRERKKTDPLYNLSTNLRTIISRLLKGHKNKRTEEILGCSFEEFKQHIEKQFEPWMNWQNNGVYSPGKQVWHLDHKVPSASAKTIEELYKLNHYTNFQPLEGLENIIKGDSLNLLEVVQN